MSVYQQIVQLSPSEQEVLFVSMITSSGEAKPLRGPGVDMLISLLTKRSPLMVMQLIDTHASHESVQMMRGRVLQVWGRLQPEEALDYYLTNQASSSQRSRIIPYIALRGVFEGFAQEGNREQWLGAISRLKGDGESRNRAQRAAISVLANELKEPDDLIQLYQDIMQSPDVNHRYAGEIVSRLAQRSAASLLKRLTRVLSKTLRQFK